MLEHQEAVAGTGEVRIGGDVLAVSKGPAGTRLVRIEDLEPETEYTVEIHAAGGGRAEESRYFPGVTRTLPAPRVQQVGSFATLNDLHFGESRIGGVLTDDHEYGDSGPGFDVIADDEVVMVEGVVAARRRLIWTR